MKLFPKGTRKLSALSDLEKLRDRGHLTNRIRNAAKVAIIAFQLPYIGLTPDENTYAQ